MKKTIVLNENPVLNWAIKNTTPPATGETPIMVREYARGTGEYVTTTLIVRGPNGKVARIDLAPSEVGQLTRAGIKKL